MLRWSTASPCATGCLVQLNFGNEVEIEPACLLERFDLGLVFKENYCKEFSSGVHRVRIWDLDKLSHKILQK